MSIIWANNGEIRQNGIKMKSVEFLENGRVVVRTGTSYEKVCFFTRSPMTSFISRGLKEEVLKLRELPLMLVGAGCLLLSGPPKLPVLHLLRRSPNHSVTP